MCELGQSCPYEQCGVDLETPSGPEVAPSATESPIGPQIFEPRKYPKVTATRELLGLPPIEADPVNSPEHYRQYPIEVIEITERLNFLLGNVIKYVLRADYKGKPLEDLKKAEWYLRREIANRESSGDSS